MRRRALVLGVALAAVGVACAKGAPSKEAFLAEADAVCKPANATATALRTPTDLAAVKDFTTRLAGNLEGSVKTIRALELPSGKDGTEAEQVMGAMQEAAASARAVGPHADRSEYTAVESTARKAADAVAAASAKARAYGFVECGKGEAEIVTLMSKSLGQAVKDAYIATADALCDAAGKRFEAIPTADDFAESEAALGQLLAVNGKLLAEIKAVAQPLTDKEKLDEILALQDQLQAKVHELQAAAAARSRTRMAPIAESVSTIAATLEGKSLAYGFKDCGTDNG